MIISDENIPYNSRRCTPHRNKVKEKNPKNLNHDQTYIYKCAPIGDLLVHIINFLGDLGAIFFPRFIFYIFFLFLLIYGGLGFWGWGIIMGS